MIQVTGKKKHITSESSSAHSRLDLATLDPCCGPWMYTRLAIALLATSALAQVPPPSAETSTEELLLDIAQAAPTMEDPVAYMHENGFECAEWEECKTGDTGAGCNISLGDERLYFVQLRKPAGKGWFVETSKSYTPDD